MTDIDLKRVLNSSKQGLKFIIENNPDKEMVDKAKEVLNIEFYSASIHQYKLSIKKEMNPGDVNERKISSIKNSTLKTLNGTLKHFCNIYEEDELLKDLFRLKDGEYTILWENISENSDYQKRVIKEIWVNEIQIEQ